MSSYTSKFFLFSFQISTENIQSLNRKNLTLNLTETSIHILKIPTERSDNKPFEVFTMKPSNYPIEKVMISNNSLNEDTSIIENKNKSNCINKIINSNGSDHDNDYLMNTIIKYNDSNQSHNTVDVKDKSGTNINKKVCKKKSRQIYSNKFNARRRIMNSKDIIVHNQSDNLQKDEVINNIDDDIIKLEDDDIDNTSDYDTASNNDVFLGNNIFIKENELIHNIDDKLGYNISDITKKSIITKGVKKRRNSRKKTEVINIKEENLKNFMTKVSAEDNSESNIRNANKRNTKELQSLKSIDSKSILPEFMSLFAKPKNDNFFSKDNMDNFSKGAYFFIMFRLEHGSSVKVFHVISHTNQMIVGNFTLKHTTCRFHNVSFIVKASEI